MVVEKGRKKPKKRGRRKKIQKILEEEPAIEEPPETATDLIINDIKTLLESVSKTTKKTLKFLDPFSKEKQDYMSPSKQDMSKEDEEFADDVIRDETLYRANIYETNYSVDYKDDEPAPTSSLPETQKLETTMKKKTKKPSPGPQEIKERDIGYCSTISDGVIWDIKVRYNLEYGRIEKIEWRMDPKNPWRRELWFRN